MPQILHSSTPFLPKVVALDDADFPIVRGEVESYKTLLLPAGLREIFEGGAQVVRINSLTVARTLPDFGGRSSGRFSLLPHQDHLDPHQDPRRFLMLSKRTDGARGATTWVMLPEVARRMVPVVERWVRDPHLRRRIAAERSHDGRFLINASQYDRCFDEEGAYDQLVGEFVKSRRHREVSIRLGVMGYLIRGSCADDVMKELRAEFAGMFYEEEWRHGGIVILDNPNVFHARFGGNDPPLMRNFCT